MKRIIKNPIFTFILGIILTSSITVVAYTTLAKDIEYTSKDTTWEVDNVKDALDDLYTKSNSKVFSIGETYRRSLYADNRGDKTANLELEAGNYICSANYGNASVSGQVSVLKQSGQFINISNCDNYNELSNYQNYQTAKEVYNNLIFSDVLVGKTFYCSVTSKKSININILANDPSNYFPVGLEVSCTKLNMTN